MLNWEPKIIYNHNIQSLNIKNIELLYHEKLKIEYLNEKTIYYWQRFSSIFHLLKIDEKKNKQDKKIFNDQFFPNLKNKII